MPVEMQGRHLSDKPHNPTLWNCPACGAEQAGRLELGCTACGSGKPGQYVGETTPAATRPTATTPPPSGVEAAFAAWIQHQPTLPDTALWTVAYAAFQAGYQAAVGAVAQPALPISGTAQSRTVIAALRLFIEHVLPHATDEIASGEYLSIPEVETLIQRLERTQ